MKKLIFISLSIFFAQESMAKENCIRSTPRPLVKLWVSGYSVKGAGNTYLTETFKKNGKNVTLKQHLCKYYTLEYLFEVNDIPEYERIPAAVKYLKSISSVAPFLIDSIIFTIFNTPMSHDMANPIIDPNNNDTIYISILKNHHKEYLSIKYNIAM